MKKVFYLSSCSSCKKILSAVDLPKDFELQDIKNKNIDKKELSHLVKLAGSVEALFSKRAMKYKSMGLKDKNLSDEELFQLILDEYTFLKRPVFIDNSTIFIGNSPKTVEKLKSHFNS